MERLLITGGAGFIGRNIIDQLPRGRYEVVTASRGDGPSLPVRHIRCDLLDAGAIARLLREARPTRLIHCAWYVNPADYIGSPENLRWVDASRWLFDAFYSAGGRRAAFIGTCFEYAQSDAPLREDSPLDPIGLYGRSKAELGQALCAEADRSALGFAWCRLFYLFGAHEQPGRFMPRLLRAIEDGQAMELNGLQARDYMYAADAALALLRVLESEHRGPVNICSGEGLSTSLLAARAAEALGRPHNITFRDAPAYPGERQMILGDAAKLSALGFAPRYGVRAGLKQMAAGLTGPG